MAEGTVPEGAATVRAAEGLVTIVEGRTFCLSAANGDIVPGLTQGLFVLDTRVLSRWELRVNGQLVEGLSVTMESPYAARFVGRSRPVPGQGDSDLVVFRRRLVGRGMSEHISVANYGTSPVPVLVEITADADLAGIFEVKAGRAPNQRHRLHATDGGALTISSGAGPAATAVQLRGSNTPLVEPGTLTWRGSVDPRQTWDLCCDTFVSFGGDLVEPRFRCDMPEDETVPALRLSSWRASFPHVRSGSTDLDSVIVQSGEDLGSLRIFDPEHPDTPILAAGVPWYMTVFGRDSLLTASMAMLGDPQLATGVLDTLARFQGDDVVAATEEEPGKILHEIRLDLTAGGSLGHADIYYGSVDATPLFVVLLAQARRWGLSDPDLARLLPHADQAIRWIEEHGDRDGDAYVEYQRSTPSGLANQGWKDSWDGIRFADGTFPQTPIALAEVQAYVYAAYLARAELAVQLGDAGTAGRCRDRAAALRVRFNQDFWLPEHRALALGLDADKRPIDAVASNMGHCLWAGIVDAGHAAHIADTILGADMFSGWGIRTLATSMRAYNPVSYHNGSVWPHDNALVADGLARYGHHDAAQRIISSQLDVATALDRRLPELFAGFDRASFPKPVAYPSSCSPQAWAAAAPLQWLVTLLGLRPDLPAGRIEVAPHIPDWLGTLVIDGVRIGERTIRIEAAGTRAEITGADDLDLLAP